MDSVLFLLVFLLILPALQVFVSPIVSVQLIVHALARSVYDVNSEQWIWFSEP